MSGHPDRPLSNAELAMYEVMAKCADDAITYFERNGSIPRELADKVWNTLDPRYYESRPRNTEFIETLFFTLLNRIQNAYGRSNDGYTQDEIATIVNEWVESRLSRGLRDEGWKQDADGEWYIPTYAERGIPRGVGTRSTTRVSTGYRDNYRDDRYNRRQRSTVRDLGGGSLFNEGTARSRSQSTSGSWADDIGDINMETSEVRPERISRPRRDEYVPKEEVRTQRNPQRSEPTVPSRSREIVKFSYTPRVASEVEKENAIAKEFALKVNRVFDAKGNETSHEPTTLEVYDLHLTVAGDEKTGISFLQKYMKDKNSYVARMHYSHPQAIKVPKSVYDKAKETIAPCISDLKNADKPGILIDDVIYESLVRNNGRIIENIIVKEFNRRIATSLFDGTKPKEHITIDELKDVDAFLEYKPYMDVDELSVWRDTVRYTFIAVLQALFTDAQYVGRDPQDGAALLAAGLDSGFIHNGLDMLNAFGGGDPKAKSDYLDAFFKEHIVIKFPSVLFYTDVLEDIRNVHEFITQNSTRCIEEDALIGGMAASVEGDKSEDAFGFLRSLMSHRMSLFARRGDRLIGFRVLYPGVPTPKRILRRDATMDVSNKNDVPVEESHKTLQTSEDILSTF